MVNGISDREQDQTNDRQCKGKNFYRQGVSICTVHVPSLQYCEQGEYRYYRKILLHGRCPDNQIAYMTMMAIVRETITATQRPGWLIVKSARLLVKKG